MLSVIKLVPLVHSLSISSRSIQIPWQVYASSHVILLQKTPETGMSLKQNVSLWNGLAGSTPAISRSNTFYWKNTSLSAYVWLWSNKEMWKSAKNASCASKELKYETKDYRKQWLIGYAYFCKNSSVHSTLLLKYQLPRCTVKNIT